MAKSPPEQQAWAEQERQFREIEDRIDQRWPMTISAVLPLFSQFACWFAPNIPLWMRITTSVILALGATWLAARAVCVWRLTFRCRHEAHADVPVRRD